MFPAQERSQASSDHMIPRTCSIMSARCNEIFVAVLHRMWSDLATTEGVTTSKNGGVQEFEPLIAVMGGTATPVPELGGARTPVSREGGNGDHDAAPQIVANGGVDGVRGGGGATPISRPSPAQGSIEGDGVPIGAGVSTCASLIDDNIVAGGASPVPSPAETNVDVDGVPPAGGGVSKSASPAQAVVDVDGVPAGASTSASPAQIAIAMDGVPAGGGVTKSASPPLATVVVDGVRIGDCAWTPRTRTRINCENIPQYTQQTQ